MHGLLRPCRRAARHRQFSVAHCACTTAVLPSLAPRASRPQSPAAQPVCCRKTGYRRVLHGTAGYRMVAWYHLVPHGTGADHSSEAVDTNMFRPLIGITWRLFTRAPAAGAAQRVPGGAGGGVNTNALMYTPVEERARCSPGRIPVQPAARLEVEV